MRITRRIRQFGIAAILVSGQAVTGENTQVEALPFCIINEPGVTAQTIVEVERRSSSGPPKLRSIRYLLRVECWRPTGLCEVMRLDLGNLEAGQPIGLLDLVLLKDMQLTSVGERVAAIARPAGSTGVTFSPGIIITIDLDNKRLEYSTSGELGQSIGVGPCAEFVFTDQPES